MILVTGATGHVGRELVAQLSERDERVRAMTRRPESTHFPANVDVVYGDFDDRASLEAAFQGVDRTFLMTAQAVGSADRPTHDLLVTDVARRAGTRHVVKLSVLGGGTGHDPLATWHRDAEAALVDSGMDWTLLRPGRFMSNTLQWAPMIRHDGTVTVPFAHWPAADIDPADIAAVACHALTEDGHRNVAYELSGPEVLTPADEVRILADALDRPLTLVELPTETARAGMLAAGMPPQVVDAIIRRSTSDHRGAEVLPTVQDVTGRAATTFVHWAHQHAGTFLGQPHHR